MKIVISNRSEVPIYEQIKAQVKEAVFSGALGEGDLLPSIRQLAKNLQISVITTARAYTDLEAEGFIATVQGKGSYVLPQNKELARENALRKVEDGLATALAAAKAGGIPRDEVARLFEILCEEDGYE